MSRKPEDVYVTREHFDATVSQLKTDVVMRIVVEMDRRASAYQSSLDALTAKVDRFIAGLDRTSGELIDNRRSLIVFDSVIGEHRRSLDSHERRISALESRLPPPAP